MALLERKKPGMRPYTWSIILFWPVVGAVVVLGASGANRDAAQGAWFALVAVFILQAVHTVGMIRKEGRSILAPANIFGISYIVFAGFIVYAAMKSINSTGR